MDSSIIMLVQYEDLGESKSYLQKYGKPIMIIIGLLVQQRLFSSLQLAGGTILSQAVPAITVWFILSHGLRVVEHLDFETATSVQFRTLVKSGIILSSWISRLICRMSEGYVQQIQISWHRLVPLINYFIRTGTIPWSGPDEVFDTITTITTFILLIIPLINFHAPISIAVCVVYQWITEKTNENEWRRRNQEEISRLQSDGLDQ